MATDIPSKEWFKPIFEDWAARPTAVMSMDRVRILALRGALEEIRDGKHSGTEGMAAAAALAIDDRAPPAETKAPPECEFPGCHGEHDTDSTHCKATCFVQGETKRCEREPNHGGEHTVRRRNTTPFRWHSPEKTSVPICGKCQTELAFEGDVCGLCNPVAAP